MYNPYFVTGLIFFVGGILIFYAFKRVNGKQKNVYTELPDAFIEKVLLDKVRFYIKLSDAERSVFKERVRYFLRKVKISGEKGAVVTDSDKVLIAASATIPLLHFETWAYENLEEVIVYPDYFDERFDTQAESKNVAGMVGSGAMNRKMVLSLPALRGGFDKYVDGNTAVHEFVHLIDKADGVVDGVPEYLIPKELIEPWMKEMNRTIREIREGDSEIRTYAGTNEAEFLAVLSEYFFKKPKKLQDEHPELFALLDKIYNRKSDI
ncbi:MAG: zinc-dependent peptidase [Sphingobacterium sp.]|jgi:Mlc titration factor MtfA (ptsG expression regulator)|nr:zinc-dependent peptidase [Sphingobacterium sp.]